jgi:hypothetical protein
MSNLGGAVSLYLGISFIALFEFFEIFVRLLWPAKDNEDEVAPEKKEND